MALYYLAVNPEAQEKAAAEAAEVAEKADSEGKITGEAFNELKYIEQVLNETLRMATVPVNFR